MPIFNGRSLSVLVTGASRGFGKCIAIELVRQAASRESVEAVRVILHGSSASPALQETLHALESVGSKSEHVDLHVSLLTCDLLDGGSIKEKFPRAMQNTDWLSSETFILFNNAGVLGSYTSTVAELEEPDFASVIQINATAMGAIAGAYLRSTEQAPNPKERFIVHTSSAVAWKPKPRWAPYNASKAASAIIHATIAKEFEDAELRTRVLQWAPGPMITDMSTPVRERNLGPSTGAAWVDPTASATKLLGILEKDVFISGQQIDFFDDADAGQLAEANASQIGGALHVRGVV